MGGRAYPPVIPSDTSFDKTGARGKLLEPIVVKQRQLQRVIGRHRLERFIRAGWIKPPRVNGRYLEYDERDVRAALKRLERGYGIELDGYARRPIIPVRAKRSGDPLADLTIDLEDELRRFSGPETKTPSVLD